MKRQTWHDLSTFYAIADAGSFTAAAVALGVSRSALSHAMSAMEARLGVRLLNRSTRSVAPTEAGERLLASLKPAMSELDETMRLLEQDRARPAGRIRISVHRSAAQLVIAPRLPAFAEAYPDIQVELAVDDGLVDIVSNGFDAGVRHEQVLENDMISVRISDKMNISYVASAGYWARCRKPSVPGDLLLHRCLAYRLTSSGALFRWRFAKEDQTIVLDPAAVFVSNDISIVRQAAIDGMGVACLLTEQVVAELDEGSLVAVLQEWSPSVPPNYLYYPNRRQMSAAMRAFVDSMRV